MDTLIMSWDLSMYYRSFLKQKYIYRRKTNAL